MPLKDGMPWKSLISITWQRYLGLFHLITNRSPWVTVSEGGVKVIFKGGGCVDALDLKIISEGYEIFLEVGDGLYLMWGLYCCFLLRG